MTACRTCGGRGQMSYQQGFFSITRTCPACQGAGQVIREACVSCRGQGRIERERVLEVGVPAGVDSGTRLRMTGQGEPGTNGGPAGRSLYFSRGERACVFRAARRRSLLHDSGQLSAGGAGREDQSPHAARAKRISKFRKARNRARFSVKRARPAESARRQGRSLRQYARGDAAKVSREQRKLLEQLGQSLKVENKPAERSSSFFDKVKDIFG